MAEDRATLKAQERTEFGSRTSRRMRREGLVPGVVYGDGAEARPFQVSARDVRDVLVHGGALFDVEIEGQGTVPVVIKEQQRDPVRGELLHLDLHEVKLDVKIEADVAIELLGIEEAPGVKEGGVLEHVTHEITIEALPTEIPESIAADVSGMVIGDTLQLSALIPPEGVEFALGEDQDADEITIATLSPPRVEEEPEPELEEETELVGEEGEVPEGEEAPEGEARPRAATPATPATRSSPCPCSAGAVAGGRRRTRSGVRRPDPDRRPRQPRQPLREDAPQRRLRGRRGALAPLGAAEGEAEVPRPDRRRAAIRAGGPRVAILVPQTYMNESGESAGPARGQLGVPLENVVVVHDEIDLPFGEVRAKLGGGVAGHNGLKSLKQGLGGADFRRVRVGVGRPDSTDPEIVSAHVLGRFAEPDERGPGADRGGGRRDRAPGRGDRVRRSPMGEAEARRR